MSSSATFNLATAPIQGLPTYRVGEVLTFALHPTNFDADLFHSPRLEVRIIDFFGPFTCSPVMQVEARTKQGPLRAVLKTYDRRYYHVLRGTKGDVTHQPASTPAQDDAWSQYVASGRAPALFDYLATGRDVDPSRPAAEHEGSYQFTAQTDCAAEVAAYRALRDLQGTGIPRFLAQASWQPLDDNNNNNQRGANRNGNGGDFFGIGAILIEHIDSVCTLANILAASSDPTKRAAIIKKSNAIAHQITAGGIFDFDRNLGNVVVEKGTLRPVHIDFAWAETTPH